MLMLFSVVAVCSFAVFFVLVVCCVSISPRSLFAFAFFRALCLLSLFVRCSYFVFRRCCAFVMFVAFVLSCPLRCVVFV